MNLIHKISFSNNFGNSLSTREAVDNLFNDVKLMHFDILELDFSKIDFVSRSFADQLIKQLNNLNEHSPFKLVILNASKEIIEVLNAVERTQVKIERTKPQVQNIRLTSREDIAEYLQAL